MLIKDAVTVRRNPLGHLLCFQLLLRGDLHPRHGHPGRLHGRRDRRAQSRVQPSDRNLPVGMVHCEHALRGCGGSELVGDFHRPRYSEPGLPVVSCGVYDRRPGGYDGRVLCYDGYGCAVL